MASRKHLKAVAYSTKTKATDTTAIVVNWPTRALHDVMTSAVEGRAITYWAQARNVVRDVDLNVVSFEVKPLDGDRRTRERRARGLDAAPTDTWRTVDAGGIALAIAFVLSGHVRVGRPLVGQIVTEKGAADEECVDVLVQIAALGELVYG